MAHRLLQPLFRLSVVVFLIGGLVIVTGQAIGIVSGKAQWVVDVETGAQPSVCLAASICGILSFALSYLRPEQPQDDTGEDNSRKLAPTAAHGH
ncbi:hypothetical protein SHJG_8731 [Streptomyces hygroscopicus subsp. jinggangensis 5008]|nr:hypothetical protein SHJG_8731 [Streptomyces hygroscopicus subsp. jinggangensis 5008]AGF68150.1 hypothetical protein SHJGH_8488 [Streptomyces hygroscopicus subsp. jinggangensis TL01]